MWPVILNIHGELQAIGYAFLMLFFVMGVVKTMSSFTELKKPEMAFKCFIRFILARAAVSHGMELMLALIAVGQGMVSTIMTTSGLSTISNITIPAEMVTIIENMGFLESIPRLGEVIFNSYTINAVYFDCGGFIK